MAERLSSAMIYALRWFDSGNDMTLDLINGYGYSAEMPRPNTVRALCARGLLGVTKKIGSWDVEMNDAGRAALKARSEASPTPASDTLPD